MTLKLFHESDLVGIIPEYCANGFHMHGLVELTEMAAKYKNVLDYWASPNKDPKVEESIPWDQFEGWCVESEDGARQSITPPWIGMENGRLAIHWRYF